MEKQRFGVIGSAHGHITEFINDMIEIGWEFAGIYNDHSDLYEHYAKEYGVPVFDDIEDLFNTGIKVAGTAAMNSDKIDFIEQCDRRGVHIISDKPIVTDYEQYLRLKKIIEKGSIEIGLMLTVRFMPEIYEIKKLIDSGEIGKLVNIEIFNPHRLIADKRSEWHFDKNRNGGIIVDLMVHSVDLFCWLIGSGIENFSGMVRKSILPEKKDFFDNAQFVVCSSTGVSGYFSVDWLMPDSHWNWGDMRVFCCGTKGRIEARVLGDPLTKEPLVVLYKNGQETAKLPVENTRRSVTIDFMNRVNRKEYMIGHGDILEATRVCTEFDKDVRIINLLD